MSWADIIKKNDKEIVNDIKPKEPDKIDEEMNNEIDYNVKDVDEEFEKIYSNVLVDIKMDFREYIMNLCLPFLDKINGHNIFYDFMKYNSINFDILCNDVNKANEEYYKEEEEYENEMEQYEADYDNYFKV